MKKYYLLVSKSNGKVCAKRHCTESYFDKVCRASFQDANAVIVSETVYINSEIGDRWTQ